MSMIRIGAGWPRLGAIVIAASMAMPGAASAQLFFDWGGSEQKANSSGRQLVRVNIDAKPGEIVVSFTDRKLYLITAPGQALSYPVAIPREQDRWEGKTTVTQKRENPSWTPTPTMIKENPRLPRWVPGGHPMNPLGNRALYLGSSFYRIHGTDAPWTIGTAVSKGCIRMYNQDALDVYERTKVGAKVLVTWNQYQATPEAEQPQALVAQPAKQAQTAAQMTSRDETPSQAAASATRPAATPVRAPDRTAQASGSRTKIDTRYSDVFGTAGPNDLPSSSAEEAAAATPPAAAPRPARTRDAQQPREPRRTREAATTPPADAPARTEAATPAATTTTASAPVQPAEKAAEPRERSAPVETGALPERRQRAKAAEPADVPKAAEARPAARTATSQPDLATRALEAAERAAAAAERAAAAAERAERAATSRSAPAVSGSD